MMGGNRWGVGFGGRRDGAYFFVWKGRVFDGVRESGWMEVVISGGWLGKFLS